MKPFLNRAVRKCVSRVKSIKASELRGRKLVRTLSWGKHFLMRFAGGPDLKVHFLMFGSYSIDRRKEGKVPKLSLSFDGGYAHFYSCAVSKLSESPARLYDWSIDPMAKQWDEAKVVGLAKADPNAFLCDVLMDQAIFAGVGNIIKNEVLYRLGHHPLRTIGELKPAQVRKLVRETRAYCFDFLKWKRAFVLIKNWKIYRRRKCPVHGTPPTIAKTGKLDRVSFFCTRCQPPP